MCIRDSLALKVTTRALMRPSRRQCTDAAKHTRRQGCLTCALVPAPTLALIALVHWCLSHNWHASHSRSRPVH
eukprot:10036670-Alexandrium_andersonii.AAC.1